MLPGKNQIGIRSDFRRVERVRVTSSCRRTWQKLNLLKCETLLMLFGIGPGIPEPLHHSSDSLTEIPQTP